MTKAFDKAIMLKNNLLDLEIMRNGLIVKISEIFVQTFKKK